MDRTIETERLTLRRLQPGDATTIADLVGDWDVLRMLAVPPCPYTIDDARAFIRDTADEPWLFAIDHHGLIGVVGITDHLGYWLGKPFWGRGYMTEAAGALISSYFQRTDEDRIISGVFTGNQASLNTLEKLGFHETGRSAMWSTPRNGEVEHIDMSLTRHDWRVRLDARGQTGD